MSKKTLLIIGAGPGISQSTAQRFANENFRIIFAGRNEEKMKSFMDVLASQEKEVKYHKVDASIAAEVINLIKSVEGEFGSIDVLHYNAAALRNQTIEEQDAESFSTDLNVNIAGALVAVKTVYAYMKSRSEGTILLTGGGFALKPAPDFLSLSIGKAGIRTISQGLFESFKQHNIHIASVTVATFVTPDSAESSGVAESLWQLYQQPKQSWTSEVIYPSN